MARTGSKDQRANLAAVTVEESVAGTLASVKFNFPFSIQDKTGLVINRIEYWPRGFHQLNGATDYIWLGLLAGKDIVDPLDQSDPVLVDSMRAIRNDYGAAASGEIIMLPVVKDWSQLPGGGLLVAPAPLYAACVGSGAAGIVGGYVKLFYTYLSLTADEYWELVESRRIISE